MRVIPGLTSTKKDRIAPWLAALRKGSAREIALFPTMLTPPERRELYDELESVPGLHLPHVHLRTDCDEAELDYLASRFGTALFNIHPAGTRHEYGPVPARYMKRVYVENVDVPPADSELHELGGICPDYSHLEAARVRGDSDYVETVERQMERFTIGCCHVSAIRRGVKNPWHGGPDFHAFSDLSDLSYMSAYRNVLPTEWISLELENSLPEQLEAVSYLESMLAEADS